jgi:uncharacterized repeat protein (TIGR04076 family)
MFKVRCKLVSFMGDIEMFPCHFNYKIGDEFYYDGMYFTGKICPGLLASMMPVIHGVFLLGNKYFENVMYRYRGFDARDLSMTKYDGLGFRPLKTLPEGVPENMRVLPSVPKTEKAKRGHFSCGDARTSAFFTCEPVDLSDSEYCQPFYRRAIALLEKIKVELGIKTDEILDRFTEFERDEISPPLTPVLLEVILDALIDMNYIKIHDGRAYPTGKEPPSRPKIE